MLAKASDGDFLGRFREVISDPLNLLIERVPRAGYVENDTVYLHNGLRVPFSGPGAYYGPFSQLLIINRGVHEPLEEFVFQEVVKRLPDDASMIELGAYWAHYSMWLKKMKPRAQVILIEPEEQFLKVGQDNFERNGFKGEFIKAFVGTGRFEIDDFFRNRKIKKLNVLHVDIQGAEVEMLEGAANVLERRRVDYFFISTHSQELHFAVIDRLKAAQYRIEASSDFENQTTSFDGFVFASSSDVPAVFKELRILHRKKIAESKGADILESLIAIERQLSHS